MNHTTLPDQSTSFIRPKVLSYYFKNYYNENKDTILERLSVNQKRRYKEDIEFKLLKRIQARIKNELPDYGGTL